ncbi:hypothetical protein BT69DRAFT_29133 [Atractiella rhizophila]|nr:hypothetical protein BT69DRAFT_29133 [Atractiella rhizophila]
MVVESGTTITISDSDTDSDSIIFAGASSLKATSKPLAPTATTSTNPFYSAQVLRPTSPSTSRSNVCVQSSTSKPPSTSVSATSNPHLIRSNFGASTSRIRVTCDSRSNVNMKGSNIVQSAEQNPVGPSALKHGFQSIARKNLVLIDLDESSSDERSEIDGNSGRGRMGVGTWRITAGDRHATWTGKVQVSAFENDWKTHLKGGGTGTTERCGGRIGAGNQSRCHRDFG